MERHSRTVLGNGSRREVVVEAVPSSSGLWAYQTRVVRGSTGRSSARAVERNPPARRIRLTSKERDPRALAARARDLESRLAEADKAVKLLEADNRVLTLDAEQANARVQRCEAELVALEDQTTAQAEQLEAAGRDVEALQVRLSDAQAELASAEAKAAADTARLTDDVTRLFTANDTLKEQAQVLRDRVADLERQLAGAKAALAAAQAAQTEQQDKEAELRRRLADMEARHDELFAASTPSNKVTALRHDLAQAKQDVAEAEGKVSSLKSQLDTTQAAASASTARIVELEMELDNSRARSAAQAEATASLHSRLAQADEDNARAEELIAKLRHDLEAATAAGATGRSATPDALPVSPTDVDDAAPPADATAALSSGLGDRILRAQLEASQAEAAELKVELNNAHDAVRAAEGDTDRVLEQLEEKKRALMVAERKLASLQADAKAAAASVTEAQAAQADMKKRMDKQMRVHRDDVQELQAAHRAATEQITKLERDLSAKNKAVLEASSRASELQKRLSESQKALQAFNEKASETDREVKRKNAALVAKRSQTDGLKKTMEAKDAELADLRARLTAAENDLAARERTLRHNQTQHQRVLADLQAKIESMQAASSEADSLKAKLAAAEDHLSASESVSSGMIRQVNEKAEQLADMEAELARHKVQLLEANDQLQLVQEATRAAIAERDAAVTRANEYVSTPQAADAGFLSLARRPDVSRLYVYTDRGTGAARLVPVATALGNDLLCNSNRSVCRLLLQNQVPIQRAAQAYAPVSAMSFDQLVQLTTDYNIMPTLCSAGELNEVFRAVNRSEADDGHRDTLDEEEFAEVLVRVAVLYMPGDYNFVCSTTDVRDNPDFGIAFRDLLQHMQDNRPPAVQDTIHFLQREGGGEAVPAVAPRSGDTVLLGLSHAQLRTRCAEAQVAAAAQAAELAAKSAIIADLRASKTGNVVVSGYKSDDDASVATAARLSTLQAEFDELKADHRSALALLHRKEEDLATSRACLTTLEAALARQAAHNKGDDTLQPLSARTTTPESLSTASPVTGLSALRHPERMFVRMGPNRLFPLLLFCGGDLICNVNRDVCRLLLQHQVALQRVFDCFAPGKDMEFHEFVALSETFKITPTMCSVDEVKEVFDSVNYGNGPDESVDAMDTESFTEALVRIAVFYAPGDFHFTGTTEDLETNPCVAPAFQTLLDAMVANRPPELPDLTFPGKHSTPKSWAGSEVSA